MIWVDVSPFPRGYFQVPCLSSGPGMYPVKRYGDDLGREKTKIIAPWPWCMCFLKGLVVFGVGVRGWFWLYRNAMASRKLHRVQPQNWSQNTSTEREPVRINLLIQIVESGRKRSYRNTVQISDPLRDTQTIQKVHNVFLFLGGPLFFQHLVFLSNKTRVKLGADFQVCQANTVTISCV